MRCKLNPRYGYLIGLTGNICTGKSLALATFKKMGFPFNLWEKSRE